MAIQKGRRMNWHYNPALSSADYFALACKRARYGDVPRNFEWVIEHGSFDFGAAPEHVEWLLDPNNVEAANRKRAALAAMGSIAHLVPEDEKRTNIV
ncbi:hypothetical protein RB623_29825 [Mesorhizobium sp. LHD-90]|uniref:hypothetical protein n=1 Tax=Mesorhizobium sp. LHD-90 TaxID=3071414 RepID=UPI0027E0EF5C|nr:hypothetical protein [Mesorhizobium sp. LHD-90]MDQ6438267.1 hypothetical protein [Mesorhizobium sp. LHD-90]